MGFRFRKTISIIPGVRLNLSKSGVSTSIGRPGATINIGKRGVRETVGIPGSGLSYSDMLISPASTVSGGTDTGSSATSGRSGMLVVIAVGVALAFIAVSRTGESETPPATLVSRVPVISETVPSVTATVMSRLKCRENPTKRSRVITTFDEGKELIVLTRGPSWSKISNTISDCWVSNDYIG